VEDLPLSLVQAYAERAVQHARIREVDPGVWVASVVGLEGAYGDGCSPDEACADLREAVVGWVAVRRRLGLEIPVLEGLDLNVPIVVPRTPA
jgi:predicted RNase H-like HicB family nuclease